MATDRHLNRMRCSGCKGLKSVRAFRCGKCAKSTRAWGLENARTFTRAPRDLYPSWSVEQADNKWI
jgi:hypothetical protein